MAFSFSSFSFSLLSCLLFTFHPCSSYFSLGAIEFFPSSYFSLSNIFDLLSSVFSIFHLLSSLFTPLSSHFSSPFYLLSPFTFHLSCLSLHSLLWFYRISLPSLLCRFSSLSSFLFSLISHLFSPSHSFLNLFFLLSALCFLLLSPFPFHLSSFSSLLSCLSSLISSTIFRIPFLIFHHLTPFNSYLSSRFSVCFTY